MFEKKVKKKKVTWALDLSLFLQPLSLSVSSLSLRFILSVCRSLALFLSFVSASFNASDSAAPRGERERVAVRKQEASLLFFASVPQSPQHLRERKRERER